MSVEGHRAQDGEDMQAFMNALSPGYFQTMNIAVQEGRDFTEADVKQDAKAVIVNRRFADHFFPGGTAIGKHLGAGSALDGPLNFEIVGVVADSLYEGPRQGVRRQVFVPKWGANAGTFYVRTTAPSAVAYTMIRQEVKALDAAMPVYAVKTLQNQLDETLASDRLVATLSAGFGLLATILASIGLYGVMAFVVVRRKKELGIRLALGARRGLVVWIVMKEVLTLLVVGLVIGVPAAFAAGRWIGSGLFGVEPLDPWIGAATVTVLVIVSAAAGLIPANRASRIDPIVALRYE
jgi:predicted permease